MSVPEVPPVTVTVPAVPGCLPVIRAVVATMAAAADLTIDDVDDATIAVEEAALLLLEHGSSELTMTVQADDGLITVTLLGDGAATDWPPPAFEGGLAGRILRGVADEVAAASDEPRLMFAKASAAR